jgi:endonuclease/exonuclease/phosphatase family metal-dependent hydrolase
MPARRESRVRSEPLPAGSDARARPRASALIAFVASAWLVGIPCHAHAEPGGSLTLATWNLEWLIAPSNFQTLKTHCLPKGAPPAPNAIPCDVAQRLERSERDFAALARYAHELNADVIALQEVDGETAARLVFPGYTFCFTRRAHVQNNGFAIRAGVPHRCGPDLESLSLGDSLRRGAQLTLYPGARHEMRLLSIHLKSGCADKPLSGDRKACHDLTRQIPALRRWIDEQERARLPYAVLGDFNRDLLGDSGPGGLWRQLAGPAERPYLLNVASGEAFRNCVPGQGYAAYIDHIVLSRAWRQAVVPGSFARLTYRPVDARRARLSDHCPVAIRTHIQQIVAPEAG